MDTCTSPRRAGRLGGEVEYQQISIREGADATMWGGGGGEIVETTGEKVDALDWGGQVMRCGGFERKGCGSGW